MLDHKTTIHAFRKLASASEMSRVSCVLACLLQREKVLGQKVNSAVAFSAVFLDSGLKVVHNVLCVKKCHKIENT